MDGEQKGPCLVHGLVLRDALLKVADNEQANILDVHIRTHKPALTNRPDTGQCAGRWRILQWWTWAWPSNGESGPSRKEHRTSSNAAVSHFHYIYPNNWSLSPKRHWWFEYKSNVIEVWSYFQMTQGCCVGYREAFKNSYFLREEVPLKTILFSPHKIRLEGPKAEEKLFENKFFVEVVSLCELVDTFLMFIWCDWAVFDFTFQQFSCMQTCGCVK